MVRGGSSSQGWKTFFRNHAQAIAAIDLFVVPTLTFERLFAFVVLGHGSLGITGVIVAIPILSGLHHHYVRI